MSYYFKDRIPDSMHGQNQRYYDAIDSTGAVKMPDFKLTLKNNIPAGSEGTPLNAANMNYASGVVDLPAAIPGALGGQTIARGQLLTLVGGKAAVPYTTPRPAAASG
ncbi:MAG: hypothetical protein FWD71_03355, partial [Oscillospiraceae bacterium]|nr:hypothetical protein [Oscillospiraceae bacterium]